MYPFVLILDTLWPVIVNDVFAACNPEYAIVNPKNVDAIFSLFPFRHYHEPSAVTICSSISLITLTYLDEALYACWYFIIFSSSSSDATPSD